MCGNTWHIYDKYIINIWHIYVSRGIIRIAPQNVDNATVLWQKVATSTCFTKTLEWFRTTSRQSKWVIRREQCVVDCALKPTTWRVAGFSTIDAIRRVNCRRTQESGWRPMVRCSTVRLDSSSIDEYVVSVRDKILFWHRYCFSYIWRFDDWRKLYAVWTIITACSLSCISFCFTGKEMFTCTFEKDTSCLLSNDYTSTTELWDVVDGRGIVDDNTLRSGL